MSKYKKEMFEFITNEENFNLAYEISELLPEIKDTLVSDFWNLVFKKLLEYDSDKEWDIELDNSEYIDVKLRGMNWDSYYSLTDITKRFWIGIYIKDKEKKDKGFIILDKSEFITGMTKGKPNYNWYYWKYMDDDFRNFSSIKNIIPSKRDGLASEIAKTYWNFINEGKEYLIQVNNNG